MVVKSFASIRRLSGVLASGCARFSQLGCLEARFSPPLAQNVVSDDLIRCHSLSFLLPPLLLATVLLRCLRRELR